MPTLTDLFRAELAEPLTAPPPDVPGLVLPPRGWTVTCGVTDVADEYVVHLPEHPGDLAMFTGLDDDGAAALLDLMPPGTLDDRQNDGPTLRRLLEAAVAHPEVVELHGYLVGPARPDERLSVEAVTVRAWSDLRVTHGHDGACECDELLDRVRALGIDDALSPPDEIRAVRPSADLDGGWYLWWD